MMLNEPVLHSWFTDFLFLNISKLDLPCPAKAS